MQTRLRAWAGKLANIVRREYTDYMNAKSLKIMQKLLRPTSSEEQAEIARRRTTPDSFEQLTLADAGLENEVRELLRSPALARNTKSAP